MYLKELHSQPFFCLRLLQYKQYHLQFFFHLLLFLFDCFYKLVLLFLLFLFSFFNNHPSPVCAQYIIRFITPSHPDVKLKFGPGYGGVGGSLRFDGTGKDWVSVPSRSNNDDEMTVSFWVRTTKNKKQLFLFLLLLLHL